MTITMLCTITNLIRYIVITQFVITIYLIRFVIVPMGKIGNVLIYLKFLIFIGNRKRYWSVRRFFLTTYISGVGFSNMRKVPYLYGTASYKEFTKQKQGYGENCVLRYRKCFDLAAGQLRNIWWAYDRLKSQSNVSGYHAVIEDGG